MLRIILSIIFMSLVAGALHTAQATTVTELEVHGHGSSASGCIYEDELTNVLGSSLSDSRQCTFGSAISFASFGVLGAEAGGVDGSGGVADESFYDTLMISGGTGLGHLLIGFGISGQSILECTNTPLATCGGTVSVQIVGPGVNKTVTQMIVAEPGIAVPESINVVMDRPFQFGIPFDFSVELDLASASFGSGMSLLSDFLDPLQPMSFLITDSLGNPVSGGTVASASGTDYQSAVAPEPSSWLLLAGGVSFLISRRVRNSLRQ